MVSFKFWQRKPPLNRVEKAAPPFIDYLFIWIPRYREKVHTSHVYKRSKEIFEEITVELGF